MISPTVSARLLCLAPAVYRPNNPLTIAMSQIPGREVHDDVSPWHFPSFFNMESEFIFISKTLFAKCAATLFYFFNNKNSKLLYFSIRMKNNMHYFRVASRACRQPGTCTGTCLSRAQLLKSRPSISFCRWKNSASPSIGYVQIPLTPLMTLSLVMVMI